VAIPESPSEKSKLRESMRRTLRALAKDSSKACTALTQWLHDNPSLHTIAVYSPLPGEVDIFPALESYPDRRWVYPKVRGLELTFHEVKNPAIDLIPGAYRILEPSVECPEVSINKIDAFLCPGLAFDSHGGRLGRGRGFYDRMLAHARADSLKIGICLEVQMVTDTFSEPHDILMNRVIF
jgi:5-formyltetrahydrofolate cyclo-ligase